MKIKDVIADLERMAAQSDKGLDMELVLWDRDSGRTFRNDGEQVWDYEITRGDLEIVIEFS